MRKDWRVVSAAILVMLMTPVLTAYPDCQKCVTDMSSDGTIQGVCTRPDDGEWGRQNCQVYYVGSDEWCQATGNACLYIVVTP
jgi:hypothetical protein